MPPSRSPVGCCAPQHGSSAAWALAGLAWVALVVLLPPARMRALVQQQLARSLAREVRFSDVGLSLLPPVRITVQSLAVSEPGGFARGIMFQTRAIHLDLDVLALLSRRVSV